ncbi:MAG: alpha/beta hydrolase [Lachnospira sp.]|nr:alpha/beta hydrolase [Lachnospira sp.]
MIRLYDGVAPGTEDLLIAEESFEEPDKEGNIKQIVQHVTEPVMYEFLPEHPTKTAVIIVPGGAFRRQVMNQEGADVAKWFNSLGIAAYVLKQRLPIDEHSNRYDVILMDMQRAIRKVRNVHETVGVIGFSAGGYATALASTGYDIDVKKLAGEGYVPDEADELSARPDFTILGYPAISLEVQTVAFAKKMGIDIAGCTIEQILLKAEELNCVPVHERAQLERYNPAKMVTADTPPAFIFETDDDKTTPCENSIEYYTALRKAGVCAELHIFAKGGHGFNLGAGKSAGQWKELLVTWIKENRLL